LRVAGLLRPPLHRRTLGFGFGTEGVGPCGLWLTNLLGGVLCGAA
jgi:hypothetical protein